MRLVIPLTCAILCLVGFNHAVCADFTFVLEPGATITPFEGTPEALNGYFTWQHVGVGGSEEVYKTISLNLISASYSLTIDPAGDRASNLFSNGTSYFNEIVNVGGFANTPFRLSSFQVGNYLGTILDPARLMYTEIWLVPFAGGQLKALIEFNATIVPEPSTLGLLSLGLIAAMLTRRRNSVPHNRV